MQPPHDSAVSARNDRGRQVTGKSTYPVPTRYPSTERSVHALFTLASWTNLIIDWIVRGHFTRLEIPGTQRFRALILLHPFRQFSPPRETLTGFIGGMSINESPIGGTSSGRCKFPRLAAIARRTVPNVNQSHVREILTFLCALIRGSNRLIGSFRDRLCVTKKTTSKDESRSQHGCLSRSISFCASV